MKTRTSDGAPDQTGREKPLVWVLQGHRAGDTLQVQALANGLGWPTQGKDLKWQKPLPRWTPFYGRSASLKHLTAQAADAFQAPWPDLVISVGWRSVPVANWIKAQCGAKLVHLGRPRAPLANFDLVLTTPQYRLPGAPNIVQLSGPLNTLSKQALNAAAKTWASRLAHLPRPWIAVLVGGDTPTLKFPPSAAEALVKGANDCAASCSGSLLVVTSPRTPAHVTDVLRDGIKAPVFFHQWAKDADNPYAAALALADQFIVTGDSISMTHEATLTGQPVQIFPLTSRKNRAREAILALDRKLRDGSAKLSHIYQGLMRGGVIYPPKSPDDYFHDLMQNGHASPLGSPAKASEIARIQPDNDRAVTAVQALFETTDEAQEISRP